MHTALATLLPCLRSSIERTTLPGEETWRLNFELLANGKLSKVQSPHQQWQWQTASPTHNETHKLNTWKLRAARAYAKIALRLEDNYGETIAGINDPHSAWLMMESSYGTSLSGIQSVLNAELMNTKWDGQSPTAHRDHMKSLRTRLATAGQTLPPQQFYNCFINSLPAEFDLVIAVHNPIPTNYSIDTLCEYNPFAPLSSERSSVPPVGVQPAAPLHYSQSRRDPDSAESLTTSTEERATHPKGSPDGKMSLAMDAGEGDT